MMNVLLLLTTLTPLTLADVMTLPYNVSTIGGNSSSQRELATSVGKDVEQRNAHQ